MGDLSHLDDSGNARMVDVGGKEITKRTARARARVLIGKKAMDLVKTGSAKKGDVLAAARIAGIMAAKKTSTLIPLCHNIPLDNCSVDFDLSEESIRISSSATCSGRTGVEMEALTAVSVAALTIYDMLKSVDKGMVIEAIQLVEKTGGRSGNYSVEDHLV